MREVSRGHCNTVVAMASGEVCTFGRGEYGRLGHGDEEGSLIPKVVAGLCV